METKILEWSENFSTLGNKNDTASLYIAETKQTKQPIIDCGAFQVVPKIKKKKETIK